MAFQKPAGSAGLHSLGDERLGCPGLSSSPKGPPSAGALRPSLGVRPGGQAEAPLRHSSSCSSSSEPEGPWRTSSYHLLVRVFICMRPWWRSWGRRHNQASGSGSGSGSGWRKRSCFVHLGWGRQGPWPQVVSKRELSQLGFFFVGAEVTGGVTQKQEWETEWAGC